MTNANITTVERALALFNAGDLEGYLATLYHADVRAHFLPPGLPQGHEGLRIFYQTFMSAFPDGRITADDAIAEGDRVVIRYHLDLTHQGEFLGIPPTGVQAVMSGSTIMRFAQDKVAERWSYNDMLGLLQQLGAIPAPQPQIYPVHNRLEG